MEIAVNVLGLAAFAAVSWGCLRLARRLGPARDGRRTQAQTQLDAAKDAGYGASEQGRRMGGGAV